MSKLKMRLALAVAGLPTIRREEGQTFVEYAMILALIGVALVGALTFLHDQIATVYSNVANAI
jgi:Flp pilus assembly pilin Flp